MSKTRQPSVKKVESPLADFFAKKGVRDAITKNINNKAPTPERAVFNDYPDEYEYYNPGFLQPLLRLHNIIRINDVDVIEAIELPQIKIWRNLAIAKALLDLFDLNNNIRPEIKAQLEEFKLQEKYPDVSINNRLLCGYLLHVGGCVNRLAGQNSYSSLSYESAILMALNTPLGSLKDLPVPEIRNMVRKELEDALDTNEIHPELRKQIRATLLGLFAAEYHQAKEAYNIAYKKLNNQLLQENDKNNPNWEVLFEAEKIHKEIVESESPKEQLNKIKLLTKALDYTAQGLSHTDDYSNHIRKSSKHAWGKRLAAVMTFSACLASIAACAGLALLISGPAIPFVIAGLATLALGALLASTILFWQDFKDKPIADAMKSVRDAPAPLIEDDTIPKPK